MVFQSTKGFDFYFALGNRNRWRGKTILQNFQG